VVEHFREIDQALAEMVRVLAPNGRLLITVPALTFSYPYLFLRGNVPAVRFIEPLVATVHFRLLGGTLATFGYERSFLRRRVAQLLERAGLSNVDVGRFDPYSPAPAVAENVQTSRSPLGPDGCVCSDVLRNPDPTLTA
jgi:SAM-dependent methyltransferase